MAEEERGPIRIRRVPSDPAPPAPPPSRSRSVDRPPAPAPAAGAKQDSAPPSSEGTGGRFFTPAGALAFLGSAAGTGRVKNVSCRREPDDGAWWAAVPLPWTDVAELVWAAGGQPFASQGGNRWVAIAPLSGPIESPTEHDLISTRSWQRLTLAELVARISPIPTTLAPAPSVDVVAPGAVARWVLKRALAVGIKVSVAPARFGPLNGEGGTGGGLLLRLRGEGRVIPTSLMHAISRIPHTIVGRPIGGEVGGMLVEAHHRITVRESLLHRMVPEHQVWVIGGPEHGNGRLTLIGKDTDGESFLQAPTLEYQDLPANEEVTLPRGVTVALVDRPLSTPRVDAVLVDDDQLAWLRDYLPGRPAGEISFLLPGAGRHLLTAPGGLTGEVPFGIPLTRVGPGGLYLESGQDFYPALPEGARRSAFELHPERPVAVIREGAYRFDISRMVPSWALWLGPIPEVTPGISPKGEGLLREISEAVRRAETEQGQIPQQQKRQPRADNRSTLLADAQRAEMAGDLVRAAELLESAGELARAGRLYERAAARLM